MNRIRESLVNHSVLIRTQVFIEIFQIFGSDQIRIKYSHEPSADSEVSANYANSISPVIEL